MPLLTVIYIPEALAADRNVNDTNAGTTGGCDASCTVEDAFADVGDGDTINIPAGTYNANAGLTIDSDEAITVIGAGEDSTEIVMAGSPGQDAIAMAGGGSGTSPVVVSGVTLNAATVPMFGIRVSDTYMGNLTLNDMTITQGSENTDGIIFEQNFTGDFNADGLTITGISRFDINFGISAPEPLSYTGDLSITNSIFRSGQSGNIWVGAYSQNASIITGNFSVTESAFEFGGLGGEGLPQSVITFFESSLTGSFTFDDNAISLTGGEGATAGAVFIIDNVFPMGEEPPPPPDMTVGSASISGNTVGATGDFGHAFIVGVPVTNGLLIDNNSVTGTMPSVEGFGGGILSVDFCYFFSEPPCVGTGDATVSNNTFDLLIPSGEVGYTGPGALSVFVNDTVTINDNAVTISDGEDGAGWNVGGIMAGASGSTINIFNNVVSGFGSFGIAAGGMISESVSVDTHIYNNIIYNGHSLEPFEVPGEEPEDPPTVYPANAIGIAVGDIAVLIGDGPPPVTSLTSTAYVYNNTIFDVTIKEGESADKSGAIVSVSDDADQGSDTINTYTFNNILQSNTNGFNAITETEGETNNITSEYNMVFGNDVNGGSNYNDIAEGDGDQVADSLFTDSGSGDFTLALLSLARDTAADSGGAGPQDAPTFDNNNDPRPARVAIDRGALEMQNLPPVADAGLDAGQADGTSANFSLDCSASTDPEDDTLTFSWEQTSGPSVTLSNDSVAQPTFTATEEGEYIFLCTASDPYGGTDSDETIRTFTPGGADDDDDDDDDGNGLTESGAPLLPIAGASGVIAGGIYSFRRWRLR
ncbi:hypothetical protein ACFL2D_02040 [Patescibacteria group bacterium]